MKLSKNKKIILLITGLGILTTSIVTPIVVINNKNNNLEKENKNDVEKVIKILEEKSNKEKIIILPNDSSGNIVANNKEKIIAKLKELIGTSNLKNVSIEVLMNQDQKISTSEQEIIVKISKGKHSKIVFSSKAYFVKKTRNAQEIIAKIKDKDILIPANISTQNPIEIQNAIKNQLKKENQTLNEDDLSKITINNIKSLTLENKIKITLIVKINSTIKKLTINVEKNNLLKNSNVDNGHNGRIFQDKFKNLWAMGFYTKLQVLEANSSGNGYVKNWTDDNSQGLLKGSNIFDGSYGTIFQDSFGNLWAMGKGTKLQVLKTNSNGTGYVSQGWTDDNSQGLLKGSNIKNGNGGTIYQDSFKNLWAMSFRAQLQVLKINLNGDGYASEGWNNDNSKELLNDSNIILEYTLGGYQGTIFQDYFGNLWAMAKGTKLQVLEINSNDNGYVKNWTDVTTEKLLNGSVITNGNGGKIFQDKFKNLWAMAETTKLQVLEANNYINSSWANNTSQRLTKGSNINNGKFGAIYQDSFGNIWAMGNGTKLQVLKANSNDNGYVPTGWTDVNTKGLLKGSNINNGNSGAIYQDSFGNLWAMGNETKLQVLKAYSNDNGYVNEGWTDVNTKGLLKGSNINNGNGGAIYQDSFGNLWAMGKNSNLQVLIANSDNTGYINSWL